MTLKKILILLLSTFFITGFYYVYLQRQNGRFSSSLSKTNNNKSQPQEQDKLKIINEVTNYQLPEGEQVYNISHGDEVKGPKAEKISYNPLNISPGKEQIITLTFPSTEIVSSGVVFITTDNLEKQKVSLKRTDQKLNVWSGRWTPSDTANKRYNATIYLLGPAGTYNNTMTFL